MAYTTINKSGDYFNTKLISGNGGTQSLTGVGFKPDFTWIKSRSRVDPHSITDIVRGVASQLDSSLNSAPTTHSDAITSFNSDGFSLGSQADVNRSGTTFASWNWLAGGSQGSSNTDGSINTTYTSVNTTAGFSISQYTGTGSNATVGHGLGVTPKMIIVKCISQTDAWGVYHSSVGAGKYLKLNETSAESTATTVFPTAQTSSIFYLGDSGLVNGSGRTYIAYCFADVTGYSKFGSYTGNGNADGTFVYTGFKPAFVMIKNTTNGNNWFISDNKRVPFNLADDSLFPNSNSAEMTTQPTNYGLDILSNGMKMRTSGSHTANNNNSSSNTYIYMAFAEAPLVGSNNVPCTAR